MFFAQVTSLSDVNFSTQIQSRVQTPNYEEKFVYKQEIDRNLMILTYKSIVFDWKLEKCISRFHRTTFVQTNLPAARHFLKFNTLSIFIVDDCCL